MADRDTPLPNHSVTVMVAVDGTEVAITAGFDTLPDLAEYATKQAAALVRVVQQVRE